MSDPSPDTTSKSEGRSRHTSPLVYELLLVLVLILAAALRLRGIYWGEFTYMHPDERFLVWVGTDIHPIGDETLGAPPTAEQMGWRTQFPDDFPDCQSWGGYFDAACSPLNPNNRGHNFYVYGTLPMFLTRYLVEWVFGQSGFAEMTKVGRPLSALADLLLVLLVYLIAARLYNRRVGLLAAAFSALAVLQIQQSHFFTMDTFITLFTTLALYFALRVSLAQGIEVKPPDPDTPGSNTRPEGRWRAFFKHPHFWLSVGFGVALGLAVASKLNAVLVAWTLPAAMLANFLSLPSQIRRDNWERWLWVAAGHLAVAGVLSVLVFRVFQPYAFTGPGFFGLKPNPMWVSNIRELMAQGAGDVDFPPSLQWARRSILYSGKNLSLYGLGLPLAFLAWSGFLWAGWRILHLDWRKHLLLWLWTAFYFGWQSLAFNPTMRYQLPVYPTLVIFAAWLVIELHDRWDSRPNLAWLRPTAIAIGGIVLLLTLAWAVGFSNIYAQPFTRVAASRWIYQNIPGPFNLHIDTGDGIYNQIVPFPNNGRIQPGIPYQASFSAKKSGAIQEIQIAQVAAQSTSVRSYQLDLTISTLPGGERPIGTARIALIPVPGGHDYVLTPDQSIRLNQDQPVYFTLQGAGGQPPITICEPLKLSVLTQGGVNEVNLSLPENCAQVPVSLPFASPDSGLLNQITLGEVVPLDEPSLTETTLTASLSSLADFQKTASGSLTGFFKPNPDDRGQAYTIVLDQPLPVQEGLSYQFEITIQPGGSDLSVAGSAIATEGDWDDGLPLRIDGYDGYGGIYTPGLNFNMYTQENIEKRERFLDILDKADAIVISSNRQWGSLPRLPERFPLSTVYYRALLGCPPEKDIFWCYAVAEPGMFQGELGFDLTYIAQSNPSLGPIEINDQFAEEAFHVYDHPKVLVFQKTATYDPSITRAILGSVDLDSVVHITPKKAGPFPADLQLPESRLQEQQSGGTWSEIFNAQAPHNRFQILGVTVWYLAVWLIGLIVYPALRKALPGLSDRGYPLSRITGLLVLAYLVWMAGSVEIPFTRLTIAVALLGMALVSAVLAYAQRAELRAEWAEKKSYFLLIETLILGLFLLFLLVRWGNPDLWHQWKGGEKPMDFAYFNAVLKSTTFPPYDPWFAGGYLNYYYYGFVIAGVPTKLLGIVPSFAYNLILATMFSLTAIGAFSIGWNLGHGKRTITGIFGILSVSILGNLGTVRMIIRGYQILVDPAFAQPGGDFFRRVGATFQGFSRVLSGETLPYSIGDWYWIPSRVMPPGDNAITEMPIFTFLYGDPHAHMFALPITLLCLAGALALLIGRARWSSAGAGLLHFGLLGLAIGSLWPVNSWDYPTFLAIGVIAVIYAFWRYAPVQAEVFKSHRLFDFMPGLPVFLRRILVTAGPALLLVLLAKNLYFPFYQWFGQGYSSIGPWTGPLTPIDSYFTHWGLFLFILTAWLFWETIDWMAKTPLSSLRKLDNYWELIYLLLAVFLVVTALLTVKLPLEEPFILGKLAFGCGANPNDISLVLGCGASVAVIALPLAAWAGVLLLRPHQPDNKRAVLFLTGTALVITLIVEVIVLRGDIGRQNTVFKLYLQAWTMLAVSAAAALAWLLSVINSWPFKSRTFFYTGLALLVGAAALFPLLGGTAKIRDRMAPEAPHTLDGMDYMQAATYNESGYEMDLSQDYRAIRWMQDNVQGSPVIVEANSGNLYRWYLRFSIYTGLPSVVGWEWHQQQQRALTPPDWVSRRLRAINEFYTSTSVDLATTFLEEYNVRYIIVGQLERATYTGPGLSKFNVYEGVHWRQVYNDRETVIYEVIAP